MFVVVVVYMWHELPQILAVVDIVRKMTEKIQVFKYGEYGSIEHLLLLLLLFICSYFFVLLCFLPPNVLMRFVSCWFLMPSQLVWSPWSDAQITRIMM